MVWLAMFLGAVLGGALQTLTGFGSGVVLILVGSRFFDMLQAPAINTVISAALTMSLAWKYRKHLSWKTAMLPTVPFVAVSVLTIRVAQNLDMGILGIVFGVFLVALSVYFLCFDKRISIRPSFPMAMACGCVSGIFAALFGVGGPLMALYFIQVTHGREEYTANIQFSFTLVNVINTLLRIADGLYTVEMVPITVLGIGGAILGMEMGNRLAGRMNIEVMKKVVYIFVGVSGLIQLMQELL